MRSALTSWFWLLLLAWAGAASAQSLPQADGEFLRGTTLDGQTWEIVHHSVSISRDGEPGYPIEGPVRVNDTVYYAVRGDVFTVDATRGVITSRTAYPTMVSALEVENGELWIKLDDGSDGATSRMKHHTGLIGRGPWVALAMLRARAEVPSALTYPDEFARHEGDWAKERAELAAAEPRDPTNALLPVFRGLAAHADGDKAAADSAFAAAVAVDAPWFDLLQVCGVLERADRPELAAKSCAKGTQKMKARGMRPEMMASLIVYVVTMKDTAEAMEAALGAEDVEAADRIAGYTFDTFPNVEGAHLAWQVLADWFGEHGRPELADKWNGRAVRAREGTLSRAFWGQTRAIDLALLFIAVCFLVLPFAGFAWGMRDDEAREGWRDWVPRGIGAPVTALLLMLSAVGATNQITAQVGLIGVAASSPLALTQEGYAAPEVITWLEGSDGAHSQALLDFARREQAAILAGTALPEDAPTPQQLYDVLLERAKTEATDALDLGPFVGKFAEFGGALPLAIPVFLSFFVLGLVGRQLRLRLPKSRIITPALIGIHAGPLLPIVPMTLLGGVLFLATPAGSILQSIATPAFNKYFGVTAVTGELTLEALYPLDAVWPWLLIIGALVVHGLTVWRHTAKPQDKP